MSALSALGAHRDATFHLLLPRGEPSLWQAADRVTGYSGDIRGIPVQILLSTHVNTLRKAIGIRIADKTVLKIMREERLLCRTADARSSVPALARSATSLSVPAGS